jgi:hypothetical protein
MYLLFLSHYYGSLLIKFKKMLPLRNKESPYLKLGYHVLRPSYVALWLLFSFLMYAAFEIIMTTNSHTTHVKIPERNKVLMLHDSVNKKWLLP